MVTMGVFRFQGKTHMIDPGIEPGTSWLVVRSCDHQATRLVTLSKCWSVVKTLANWTRNKRRKSSGFFYVRTVSVITFRIYVVPVKFDNNRISWKSIQQFLSCLLVNWEENRHGIACGHNFFKFYFTNVQRINLLKPKDIYIYICRTAALTSRSYILNIYSTNIHTEYFKHAA